MAFIRRDALRAAATRQLPVIARSLNEAVASGAKTAFLCHSHSDRDLAKGLANLLRETGWRLYIDWEDAAMPARPDSTTAARIQQRITQLH
jgi:hypothetical protein